MNRHWADSAVATVIQAIRMGRTERNTEAAIAARALIPWWEREQFPSIYNFQFALGVFFLREPGELDLYAWRMVANGLSGFWQWQTLNGFSVTAALQHLDLITVEEAAVTTKQFVVEEYPVVGDFRGPFRFVRVRKELLSRIVQKFWLPTMNLEVSGREVLSMEDIRRRHSFQLRAPRFLDEHDNIRYQKALRSM